MLLCPESGHQAVKRGAGDELVRVLFAFLTALLLLEFSNSFFSRNIVKRMQKHHGETRQFQFGRVRPVTPPKIRNLYRSQVDPSAGGAPSGRRRGHQDQARQLRRCLKDEPGRFDAWPIRQNAKLCVQSAEAKGIGNSPASTPVASNPIALHAHRWPHLCAAFL